VGAIRPVRAVEDTDAASLPSLDARTCSRNTGTGRAGGEAGGEVSGTDKGSGGEVESPSWSAAASVSLYCAFRRLCSALCWGLGAFSAFRSNGVPPVVWAPEFAPPVTRESGPLVFHHCIDIWASISSIFLSVIGPVVRLGRQAALEERRTHALAALTAGTSRLRILRSMSNSRLRTKSLRRLRSIISLSAALLYSLSRSALRVSRSDQLVVG
jgi:hypothetical protein